MLRSIWQFRDFIRSLVLRDFQTRSARALWGHAWLAIGPAIQILIYVVIFAEVLRARLPGETDPLSYGLYVCAGLLTWNFFAELLLEGRTLFIEQADLLRTIRFPRATLPIALLLRSSINAAIPVAMFLLLLALTGRWPGSVLAAAVPFLLVQTLLGIGLAVLVGTLNVFVRDVGNFTLVALQFWFWLTPIVYPLTIVPERARGFLEWNPMLHVVRAYQSVVVQRQLPEMGMLIPLMALSLSVALGAWAVFRRLSPDLVDEL